MTKLIQEAQLDERFKTQVGKAQDAVDKLDALLAEMTKEGSMHKPTATQRMQLRYLAEDFKRLHEKSQ